MKKLKVLLLALLTLVTVIAVTGVSFAAWIFSENDELPILVDSGAWDAESTNTYNLEYEELLGSDGNVTGYKVIGFKSEMVGTTVRIPSSYNNLPITAIGSSFCGETEKLQLFKLVIPSSVQTIDIDALSYLGMLSTLVIEGNGLQNLGDRVLYNCSSLVNIVLPSSVTTIGSDVLSDCINLTKIDVRARAANINLGEEIVRFGLKSDGTLPNIIFGGVAV